MYLNKPHDYYVAEKSRITQWFYLETDSGMDEDRRSSTTLKIKSCLKKTKTKLMR